MMRRLHIIMPMAGEGSRFVAEGCMVPKPLIQVSKKPLFMRALSSVDRIDAHKCYSFIVRQAHIDASEIDREILKRCPDAHIVSVRQTTRGAVETCLMARDHIADEDGVLLLDCDLEFYSSSFNTAIEEVLAESACATAGGVLLSFTSNNPRYSYALTDLHNTVLRTAEKEVISKHALAGAYFFSTGRLFLMAAERLMVDVARRQSELYISLLYNYLIEAGQVVRLTHVDRYRSFGTPQELREYERSDQTYSNRP